MIGTKHLVFLAAALYARCSTALPPSVYQEDHDYDEGNHHHHQYHQLHHAPPPATSYATISTTHVKVQHPPAPTSVKYATPYKYEYLTQPRMTYEYVSLPSAGGKYEEPSTPGYKYLAASPTYKYVQPPAVTTEPEAAEEPTNALKYAFKYEQNAFRQQQRLEYEQPAVRYKYVAVPSYDYADDDDDKRQ